MTTTKQSWLKRSLAVLLAVMMVMSMGIVNVFAAGGEGDESAPAAGYSTEQTENSVMSLTAGENTYYFDDVASAFAAVDDTTNITGDVTLKLLKDGQTYPVGTVDSSSTTVFENATGTVTLDLNGFDLTMAGQREGSSCSVKIASPSFTLTDNTNIESKAIVDGKENTSFDVGSLNLTNAYLQFSGAGQLAIKNIKGTVTGENGGRFITSAKTSEIDNVSITRNNLSEDSQDVMAITGGGVISGSVIKNDNGGAVTAKGITLRNNVMEGTSGLIYLPSNGNVIVESGSYTATGANGVVYARSRATKAELKGGVFTGDLVTSNNDAEIVITGGYYKGEWIQTRGTISADGCNREEITDGEYAGYIKYTLAIQRTATVSVVDENGKVTTAASVSAVANGEMLPDLNNVYAGQLTTYMVDCKQDYEVKKITYTPNGEASQEIAGNSTYAMTVPDQDYTLIFTVGETEAVKNGEDVVSIGNKQYKSLTTAMNELKDNDVLKLEKDFTYTDVPEFNKNDVTLDLNGKTLTMDVAPQGDTQISSYKILVSGGSLTIADYTQEKNGAISFNKGFGSGIRITGTNTKVTLTGGTLKDVYNGLQCGNILCEATEGEVNISGGLVLGRIKLEQPGSKLNISDGKIVAEDNCYVLGVGTGGSINITGGEIYIGENLSASSSGGNISLINTEGAAEDDIFRMTGGRIVSETSGAGIIYATALAGNIEIGGDAILESHDGPIIFAYPGYDYNLSIEDNAILSGGTYAIEIKESEQFRPLNLSINGGYYQYNEEYIPISNTKYVTYPEGYVLNTKPETTGEYQGYYTLATKDSLGGTYYSEATGITSDYTYQDFTGASDGTGSGLDDVLETAESIYTAGNEDSTYLDEVWLQFENAYLSAVEVRQNLNANQTEIDYRSTLLSESLRDLESTASFDINSLADGTYHIDVALWKYNFSSYSMANDAVDPTATLIVKDGAASLSLNFGPAYVAGLYGHLESFFVYQGKDWNEATTYKDMAPEEASEIGMRKEADYSRWYAATTNDPSVTYRTDIDGIDEKTDIYSFPGTVQVDLPYWGTSNDLRTYWIGVDVDAMGGYATANLMLNWSSLEAVKVEPTLSLSAYELSMMVGDEETVTATLKGEVSQDYVVTGWSSDKESIATVDNGTIKAVGEGTATITVTASNGTDTLTKTIAVTVAPEGSEAVKVEKVETSGNTETATLSGSFLTSSGVEGIAVNGNTVTVDVKSGTSGITASNVVIPQETAQALAGKTVVVETNTGTITLNSTLLAQIAGVENGVTLSISKASTPVGLGTFSSAYEISLVDANGDAVEFGEGQATVTVTSEETVNYAYCIDNGQRTERVATSTSGNSVSFTVSHFSLWALSDREYEVGGSASSSFFLEDGNYYVDIALWKSDSNEASMGNVAFKNNDKALVTVEDGKITRVQIGTNPVDIDPYHSAIISFELADGTEVSIDATGELTTLPANKDYTYIKLVSFNLPDSAQPDISDAITYVPVNFYVPDTPMDAAVGETLTARLRFTWSTAVKTDDTSLQVDDTTAAGDSPITGEEIVDVNLVDEATGIKLETNSGILSDKAVLSVEKLTQGADYDIAMKAMNGVDGSWNLYKITALVGGVETAPLGSVVLYIPCGAEGMTLYRVNTDGTKTLVRGEVQDGYYVVRTTSLGLFAMVGEAAGTPGGTQDGNQNGNTTVPQTGDSSSVAVYALLALAAAGMMGVTLVTRKRKAEEK